MTRRHNYLISLFVALSVVLPAAPSVAAAASPPQGALFCTGVNYTGACYALPLGRFTRAQLAATTSVPNDSIASVRVMGDTQVTLYDGDVADANWTLTQSTPDLSTLQAAQKMSSVVMLPAPATAVQLVNPHGNLCLDVYYDRSVDGTPVHVATCFNNGAQLFSFVPAANGYATLIGRDSQKCLDIANSSSDNTTPIQLWDCTGGANQQFELVPTGIDDVYGLRTALSQKCIDVYGASTVSGTQVQEFDCYTTVAQQWQVVTAGTVPAPAVAVGPNPPATPVRGALLCTGANFAGKCTSLALGRYGFADMLATGIPNDAVNSVQVLGDAEVTLYTDDFSGPSWTLAQTVPDLGSFSAGNAVSSLSILPNPRKAFQLVNPHSQLCFDVKNDSSANGTVLDIATCDNLGSQLFTLVSLDNKNVALRNADTGKCVDINGANPADGAAITLWDCSYQANQQFQLKEGPADTYHLVAPFSQKCIDIIGASTTSGTQVHQYTCYDGPAQQWQLVEAGVKVAPLPPPAPPAPPAPTQPNPNFGNATLHPDRIGFYMVPDLAPAYTAGGQSPAGWCPWTATQASLLKLHALLPNAWIRWDNETGHYSDSPDSVSTFVSCANAAGVGMIVTASAIDGYNNWWANGNKPPNASLIDIANGPYLNFAHQLMSQYPVVRLVETANEPDGPWFVNDGDNASHFDYYMQKLQAAMGADTGRIVGPSAAFTSSNIWNYFVSRNYSNISYHTYGGWSALGDVSGRNVYVTEYGGFDLNPGAVLADLWQAERNNKLAGSIQKVFYQQITDNGGNRGAFNMNAYENNHFALRDWFRALTLYQAVANINTRAVLDDSHPDYVASDDGQGHFAALLWNNSGGTESGQVRTINGVSVGANTLHVLHLMQGDNGVASCLSLGAAGALLSAQVQGSTITLTVRGLEPHAAMLVTTADCTDLAN